MPIASSLLNKPRLVEKLRKFYNYVQKNDGRVGNKTRGIAKCQGVGRVNNKLACSAEFTIVLPHIINYYKKK